jgi:outer membrane murein-binding lipoprotein Lpp
MRPFAVATMVMAMCAATAMAGEPAQATTDDLLREVRELRQQVEQLTRRVEALEAVLAQAPEEFALPSEEDWSLRGPDPAALAAIQLPPNPSREAVREYIRRICAASDGQSFASTNDPQARMLRRVGPENLDILLDSLRSAEWGVAEVYLVQAIEHLARDEHKEDILEYLPVAPELVSVVLRYGWAADARGVLLSELQVPDAYLPFGWLQAVGSLRDAEAAAALKAYFVGGAQREEAFEVLRAMPGVEDLDGLVDQAWIRARAESDEQAVGAARVAVGYGHEDALALLVRSLAEDRDPYGSAPSNRRAILAHTEATGTGEAIVRWYEQSRERLYWDPDARRFRARSDEGAPAAGEAESAP